MHLAKFRDHWRTVVNIVSNAENCVITLPTLSFSRKAVHAVDFWLVLYTLCLYDSCVYLHSKRIWHMMKVDVCMLGLIFRLSEFDWICSWGFTRAQWWLFKVKEHFINFLFCLYQPTWHKYTYIIVCFEFFSSHIFKILWTERKEYVLLVALLFIVYTTWCQRGEIIDVEGPVRRQLRRCLELEALFAVEIVTESK